jgi:DNA-binding transcriptional MerR regulator
VVPARDGHKRIYSLDDLAEIAIICELRERGFSLQKIRRVIRFLQRELGKRLVETVRAASEYHLLTDGRHIFLEDSARGVVDLLKNARQPMLSICLSDTVQRIDANLRGGRKRSASVRHPIQRRRAS